MAPRIWHAMPAAAAACMCAAAGCACLPGATWQRGVCLWTSRAQHPKPAPACSGLPAALAMPAAGAARGVGTDKKWLGMDVWTHPTAARLRQAADSALHQAAALRRQTRQAQLTQAAAVSATVETGEAAVGAAALEALPKALMDALVEVESVVVDGPDCGNAHFRSDLSRLQQELSQELMAALAHASASPTSSPSFSPATTRWNADGPPELALGKPAITPAVEGRCSLLESLPTEVLLENVLDGAEQAALGALRCTSRRLAASLASTAADTLWQRQWKSHAQLWDASLASRAIAGEGRQSWRQRYCHRANLDAAWLSTAVEMTPVVDSVSSTTTSLTLRPAPRPSAMADRTAVAWLCAPQHAVCSLSFDSDSSSVATGDTTGIVRLWDVRRACASYRCDQAGAARPSHGRRAVGSATGVGRDARLAVIRVAGKSAGPVLWTAHSGRRLLAACTNGRVAYYDLDSVGGSAGNSGGLSLAAGQTRLGPLEARCGLLGGGSTQFAVGGTGLPENLCWVGGGQHLRCIRLPDLDAEWDGKRAQQLESVGRYSVSDHEDGSELLAIMSLGGGGSGYATGPASANAALVTVADSLGAVSLLDLATDRGPADVDAAGNGGGGRAAGVDAILRWPCPREALCRGVSLAAVPAFSSAWVAGTSYASGAGGCLSLVDARSAALASTHSHDRGICALFAPPACSLPLMLVAEADDGGATMAGESAGSCVRVVDLRMVRPSAQWEALSDWRACRWADVLLDISHDRALPSSSQHQPPASNSATTGTLLAGDNSTLVAVVQGGAGAVIVSRDGENSSTSAGARPNPSQRGSPASFPAAAGGASSPGSPPSSSSSSPHGRPKSRAEKNKAKKKAQDHLAGEVDKGNGGRRRFPKKNNRRKQ